MSADFIIVVESIQAAASALRDCKESFKDQAHENKLRESLLRVRKVAYSACVETGLKEETKVLVGRVGICLDGIFATLSPALPAPILALDDHLNSARQAEVLEKLLKGSVWSHCTRLGVLKAFSYDANYKLTKEDCEAWSAIALGAIKNLLDAIKDNQKHLYSFNEVDNFTVTVKEIEALPFETIVCELFEACKQSIDTCGADKELVDHSALLLRSIEEFWEPSYAQLYEYDCLSLHEVLADTGMTAYSLFQAFASRKLLVVPATSHPVEMQFPRFQFVKTTDTRTKRDSEFREIRKDVAYCLENTTPAFSGHEAALWFWIHGAKKFSLDSNKDNELDMSQTWEPKLTDIGLWNSALGEASSLNIPPELSTFLTNLQPSTLFRITRRKFPQPFFYSHVAQWDGKYGRFDLLEVSENDPEPQYGTCYFGFTALGAFNEVFERLPYVSLDDLISYSLWQATFSVKIENVFDASHFGVNIVSTSRRRDTQGYATELHRCSNPAITSIKYRLRSQVSEYGFAVFSPIRLNLREKDFSTFAMEHLPMHQPIVGGVWEVSTLPMEHNRAVWKELITLYRQRFDASISFVRLPRFPNSAQN